MSSNFPRHVPHKIHLVTLVRSGIRRPYWEKRTLKKLGLTKRCRQVVVQNTPQVNAELVTIKTLINVQPVIIDEDSSQDTTCPAELKNLTDDISKVTDNLGELKLLTGPFLDVNGNFSKKKYKEYLESFPDKELHKVLSKPHMRKSDMLNRDFLKEEEEKISDKGEQIELYFKKKTWKYPSRMENRMKNTSKY